MVIVDFALEHEIDPEHLERMLLKKYPTVCGDDFENSVAEVIEEYKRVASNYLRPLSSLKA
jgi:hypothetical protein